MAYSKINYGVSIESTIPGSEVADGVFFQGTIDCNTSLFFRVGTRIVDLEDTDTMYPVRGTQIQNYKLVDIEITVI